MGRQATLARALGLLLVGASLPATAGMDPTSLRLERMADDVRLSWVGDDPTYVIYRSDDPTTVEAAPNELSTSVISEYVDPLSGISCASCYYLVVPDHRFACGELTCSADDQYCLILYPGVPEAPPQHSCPTTPAECLADPTCSCVQAAIDDEWPALASECMQDGDGPITISVYAP